MPREWPYENLLRRCWTPELIARYLDPCDRITGRGTGQYAIDRVEQVEQTVPEVRERVLWRPKRFDQTFVDVAPGANVVVSGPSAEVRATVKVSYRGRWLMQYQSQDVDTVGLARGCVAVGFLDPLLDWLMERCELDTRAATVVAGLATRNPAVLDEVWVQQEAEAAAERVREAERVRLRREQERLRHEEWVRGEPERRRAAAEARLAEAERRVAANEEALDAEVGTDFITVSGLKYRGWTDGMVESRLGEPDKLAKNHHCFSGPPKRLYARERVMRAEADPQCRAAREKTIRLRRARTERLRASVEQTMACAP